VAAADQQRRRRTPGDRAGKDHGAREGRGRIHACDRHRDPAVHAETRSLAPQRRDHGDAVSRDRSHDGPDRSAGDHRPAAAPDRGRRDVCGAQHACCRPQDADADRHAAVQQEGDLRGGRERRRAPRLLDEGQPNPPVHVLRPPGDPVAGGTPQHAGPGEHRDPTGDEERSRRIAHGLDRRGRDPWVRAPALLHGAARRRGCAPSSARPASWRAVLPRTG